MSASRVRRLGLMALVIWALQTSVTLAQWAQQRFPLDAGWNAVYFELDPEPADAGVLFEGLPIKAVWTRSDTIPTNPRVDCIDSPDDPACGESPDPGWRVWFPESEPQHVINSLRLIRGGRVYLIQASRPATFTITGKPDAALTRWREGFNLAGFHVVDNAQSAPTFSRYLEPSPGHQGTAIYEINSDGTYSRISDPDDRRITPGEGYWVEASRNMIYDGPVQIDPRSLRGVDLLSGITEHAIQIENLSSQQSQVTIANPPPVRPAGAAQAETSGSEGRVPLLWFDFAGTEESDTPVQWRPLEAVTMSLEATGQRGSSRVLRVAVRRRDLADLGRDRNANGDYFGVLRVTDGEGYQRQLPFRTRGGDQNGLWVGDVSVNSVNEVHAEDPNDGEPTPTSSEFVFRIIIHKSDTGYRLLRDVVLVWQDLTSRYVLATPDCSGLRDPQRFSPRVSSANFSFDGDLQLTGDFDTQLLSVNEWGIGTLAVVAGHPLNPYRHAFNPEHGTGYYIARNLTLTFDADGSGDPEWGVTRLGGTYEESINGLLAPLNQPTIKAQGRFELRRISSIASLCGR